ncbi:1-deoxy-D-xylulose-5-phosphate synthase [Francisellaceae bacterium]|nr:1-deoxy-D-xylulose-5-phosphate synthase [Francisellaceae bacterium]
MNAADNKYPILDRINTPQDLKQIPKEDLPALAKEIRSFLVNSLDISGGHFASSLGALELSVALHYVYDTPKDNIVWDVGHQAYIHKILTGRKDQLTSIKKPGGIAGFPKRAESEYDAFGVGHSSTSISAALGMSEAAKLKGEDHRAVAVIGDGAMTGGMAFEALNHAGGMHSDILVVLNDNDMSISENVGALSNYFAKMLSGSVYTSIREGSKKFLKKLPAAWELAKKFEAQAKGMIMPGNLFESLGFYHVGPVDGHDIATLIEALENLKAHKGPRLLHIATKKGKGYARAEEDPINFHHVGPKFHTAADIKKEKTAAVSTLTFSEVFGKWMCDHAAKDKRLVGITPAMREGSGLVGFSKAFPARYFDAAIAEQHAVTLAAGMACEGIKPVVAIYSTFLQRAYDQVIHDMSIQNLDVLYAVDRAGLVGADGPTHAGSFDLSFMRCLPNTVVMTPSNENECYHMLTLGFEHQGPAMVRYPRGTGTGEVITEKLELGMGKAQILRKGKALVILSFGTVTKYALKAANELDATVVDMRFVKPLDETLIKQLAESHDSLITLEENAVKGGAGSAVNEFLIANDLLNGVKVRNIGLPDIYQDHGVCEEMLADAGISKAGIISTFSEMQE